MPAERNRIKASALLRYGCAFLTTALGIGVRLLMMSRGGGRLTYTPFFVAATLTAWYGGIGPALTAIALGAIAGYKLAGNALVIRPGPYIVVMLVIALVMESQRRALRRLEQETAERRRLEEAEKRERRWSHITLSSIGDAVITTDANGVINFMNSVAESLTGWNFADSVGQPLDKVFHIVNENTLEKVENPVVRVLREGVVVGLANHTALVRRDGSMVPIDDSGAPVRDENQTITGAVLVFRDFTDRRKSMHAIQDSQQRLELALDAGKMGTWEWDIRTNRITLSANLELMHGLEPGSFTGTFEEFEQIIHPEDRERVMASMRHALESREHYRLEYRIVKQDGTICWAEARGRLVVDESGAAERLTGVCMDVSLRMEAAEKLRIRLAQQNAVSRLGALALSSRDQARLLQTAVNLVVNELGVEFASILEAQPDGNGLVLRAGNGWPGPDRVGDIIRAGRESQAGYTLLAEAPVVVEAFEGETRFRVSRLLVDLQVSSGISVVIPGEKRAFGVLAAYALRRRAFTTEDTQFMQAVANIVANAVRRQREEDARERLAAILESSEDAIIGKTLEGIVESWNRGAEHIYGYAAAEMIGRPINILVPPDRPDEEAAILQKIRRGEAVQSLESVRVRKDGTRIHVSLTVSPIRDRRGQVIGASHSARDISERRRVEEKIQQTQKLESLGILAGGIAHDFNNLLTGILGNASLITDMLPPLSPTYELAESVIQAAERAAHLTRQMLAYSGRGRFLIQSANVSQQVREITALIAASIPKNVQLRLNLQDDLPLIEADTGQFQQLVMNLVINGAEAVDEGGGTVTISTGLEQIGEEDIAGLTYAADLKPGEYIVLEVRDTGCGMDAATVAKIFDPFFTTKFTGRGLGLAAVLGIMRGHQGAVNVRSAPGKGTTFKVLFPLASRQVKEIRPALAAVPQAGKVTVLVVDDEEMVRRAGKASLERYGYRVLTADDGRRAIDLFRKIPDEIGLVLLDMTMPGISGEQTFVELRKLRPDLPVIASSGYSEAEALARFGEGLAGFIQKPYSAAQLASKVGEVLAGKSKGFTGAAG